MILIEKNENKWTTDVKILENVILFLFPCISYVLFELVTGNLRDIIVWYHLVNIGWYYAVYLLIFAISGRTHVTIPIASVLFYALSLAETFVVSFRNRPIMIWDFLAARTAATVAGNYDFYATKKMIAAGITVIAMIILAVLWPRTVKKGWKNRLIASACALIFPIGYAVFFFGYLISAWNMGIDVWNPVLSYEAMGYVAATAISCKYAVVEKPDGYSLSAIEQLGNDYGVPLASETDTPIIPVNLICIMNESLADLHVAGDFETNQDYFPFFHSLTENALKGNLCVPVFGSGTSSTEFEFITGASMTMFPEGSNPYQFNVHSGAPSLVSTVKDQGYRAVAIHPNAPQNWNREECYENFGFDEFLSLDDFEVKDGLRDFVSDHDDYQKLIQLVEEKESPDEKLFLFNVTMQNHGGYVLHFDNFQQEIGLVEDMEATYTMADQYFSLMKKSDEALEYLISYFRQCEEPTMIVLFGDHQPSVEDEFYDQIAGKPSSETTTQESIKWYKTPYLIWTNYEMPDADQDEGEFSAFYLSSIALERAGLKMTAFNRYLLEMKEELPVVHKTGCYDADGNYYKWAEIRDPEDPFYEEIQDYNELVYNHSYDRHKVKNMFWLAEEATK